MNIIHVSQHSKIRFTNAKCSSYLSDKNVFSNFLNEWLTGCSGKDLFIIAGGSFQIVGPETLYDLECKLSWFLVYIAALKW